MTNNKTNTTLTKKGKNTMTTAYLEDKFTDKTFNETIFIMCDCNCPQCNDEVEVEVEFEATAHQYEHQGEIGFDVDVRQIISATAVDSNCQSIVDAGHYSNGVHDECRSIAEDFASME
tara:strand:- start:61 stop:414 length:354 start_codon:yes stop_codon:yes gene_type:complete